MKQNSPSKQKALRTELELAARHVQSSTEDQPIAAHATKSVAAPVEDEHIRAAAQAASDKKALNLVALDLRSIASFTDYFLITSGTNTRQVQAIADEIVERLKKMGRRATRVEGYNTAEWVLVDYGDFVVHIFEDKARHFYDLERLWREAVRVDIPLDDEPGKAGNSDASRSEER
ncbi:MAG: ribosome silencing factor [Pyrinomonadaceae bacterium]